MRGKRGQNLKRRGKKNSKPKTKKEKKSEEEDEELELVREEGEEEVRKKVGKKKRAKMEMKQRRGEARERERLREGVEEEREEVEGEDAEEKELERIRKEIKEKEEEEYLKWKGEMEVAESGSVHLSEEEQKKIEVQFAEYVRQNKMVLLEDLVADFRMDVESVVRLLERLEKEGKICGLIDERGKYVYLTPEEMQDISRWIESKGRVSLKDLSTEINKFIKI